MKKSTVKFRVIMFVLSGLFFLIFAGQVYAIDSAQGPKVLWQNSGLSVQQRINQNQIPVFNIYYSHRPLIDQDFHGFNGVYTAKCADKSLLVSALFSDAGGYFSSLHTFNVKNGIVKKIASPFKAKGDLPINIRQNNDIITLYRFASIKNDIFNIAIDFELARWELTSNTWKSVTIFRDKNSKDIFANRLYQADMDFRKGNYKSAVFYFNKLVTNSIVKKSYPEIHSMALYYLAKSYALDVNPENAIIAYEDFVNVYSTHSFADIAQAESEFLDMSARFNYSILQGYLFAEAAYLGSNNIKALDFIEKALKKYSPSKNDVYIQNLLGRVFYLAAQLNHKAGNMKRATELYEKGSLFNCEPAVRRQCISALKKLK